MADVTTFLDNRGAQLSRAVRTITRRVTLPSSGIANGDHVQLYTFPPGANERIHGVSVKAAGTLGASATVKAQINRDDSRTDLSAATTAGGASRVSGSALTSVPFDAEPGDIVELLVGGANISASAVVEVDIQVTPR